MRVETAQQNLLNIRTLGFPGWEAKVNGDPQPAFAHKQLGNILLALPAGSHDVELTFRATSDRRLGAILSGVGLILLTCGGGLAIRERIQSKPVDGEPRL
jgi:hypothetical protein